MIQALDVVEACLAKESVDERDAAILAGIPHLGLPPLTMGQRRPLALRKFDAPPGSWSQVAELMIRSAASKQNRSNGLVLHVLRATRRSLRLACKAEDIEIPRPPLYTGRVTGLLNNAVDQNVDHGDEETDAAYEACAWMLRSVIPQEAERRELSLEDIADFNKEVVDFLEEVLTDAKIPDPRKTAHSWFLNFMDSVAAQKAA